MPWFKVSDDLPSRASTTRIPRPHRCAALGLWALAGAWSAAQLTDGHIPAHMLEELSGTAESADWLVTAGIWEPIEDGWQFSEWAPDQPLRETVLEARRKNAERVTSWRSRNRPRGNTAGNGVTPGVTNPVTNDAVTLPPTRPNPDPSQSNKELVQPKVERDNALEVEFAEFWKCWPRKQAKADALKAYKAARKHTEAETILAGVQRYKLLTIGQEKRFLKLPAGWLRDERWNDEDIPQTPSKDDRARATLQMGRDLAIDPGYGRPPRQDETPPECAIHPGYPDTPLAPCGACQREALALPEGANF